MALAVIVLVWLTWPPTSLLATAGLDDSWRVGLSLALSRGIDFGRHLVFTYGPLGLVTAPTAVSPGTVLVGVLGAAIIEIALATVLLVCLRRRLPLVLATLVALATMLIVVTSGIPTLEVIAFGFVVIALTASPPDALRAARTLAIVGGAFAGLALLVKLNDGIAVTAIVGAGLLGAPGTRRTVPLGVGVLVITMLLAWIVLGQPVASLPDYVRYGYQIVVGYVDSMGYDGLGVNGEWEVLVVIASAVALSVGAWFSMAERPRRSQAALVAAVLLVHYFVAREMFVRYDAGHAGALALLVPVAVLIPWRRQQFGAGLAVASALAIASLAVFALNGVALGVVFAPTTRAGQLIDDIGTVLSPATAISDGRINVRAAEGIPRSFQRLLSGHCVSAEPGEISAIFAYPSWRWCPIGVMQSYSAYTRSLDELDAAGYANARSGPDRVLRQVNQTIDGRNPTWESPAAMLSLLCHFQEVGAGAAWQVLARIPNRCGSPRVLAVLHSGVNDVLTVPPDPPGEVLVANIYGLQMHGGERLGTLFNRAAPRHLVVNGLGYRVVPGTVGDGLVLDVPADADAAPPFHYDLSASTLVAEINGKPVPFTATVIAVPIAPNPPLR
jgi:hypothetical protein